MTDGLARVLKVENVAGIQTRSQGRDQYQRVEGTVEDPCRKIEKNIARITNLRCWPCALRRRRLGRSS